MAEFSWPTPDPENDGKRVVSDAEFEQIAHAGATGVLAAVGAQNPVFADGTGRHVKWRPNLRQLVYGYGWRTDSEGLTVDVDENTSGQTRIDLAVLRLDRTARAVNAVVIPGTPGSSSPPLPASDEDFYGPGPIDFQQAAIVVPNNATTILAEQVANWSWQTGPSGQIRFREPLTRMPHSHGRLVWDPDTLTLRVSTGTQWRTVQEDTDWIPFAPAAGWTSLQCRGRRRNGMVYLQLEVSRVGNLAAGVAADLATIPPALRPDSTVNAVGLIVTGTGPARIVINSSGLVRILEHSLQVGNTGFLLVNHAYPAGTL